MVELRVRVELPAPPEVSVTLVGLREAVRPEGATVETRETVPANPFTLVTFTLLVLARPVTTIKLVGAEIVKSVIVTMILTE